MLGTNLRKVFSNMVFKIGKTIGKTGINPNFFTFLGVIVAGFAAYLYSQQEMLLGFIFIIAASFWDAIDGSVARAQNKASKFGNYFDAMIDKYVEILFYLVLALAGFPLEAFLVISGSLILSYAKPRTAIVVPIDNHDWPAIGERLDRLLILVAVLAIALFAPMLTIGGRTFSTISMW